MVSFFVGLFLGALVTFIVLSSISIERQHESYWQGYLQCAEDAKKVQQEERSSNEADI